MNHTLLFEIYVPPVPLSHLRMDIQFIFHSRIRYAWIELRIDLPFATRPAPRNLNLLLPQYLA